MEPNAILAVNSLDRYNKNQNATGKFASFGASLENQYDNTGQPCNNFQVGGFGALIYGYIKKIQISQIQLEYNVPTVIAGQNDNFLIFAREIATGNLTTSLITLPFGYYTPQELAVIMELKINQSTVGTTVSDVIVSYRSSDNDFLFESGNPQNYTIYFPDIVAMKLYISANNLAPNDYILILKAYRLIGISILNSFPATEQFTGATPNFLYTPYVDIYSTALTKYQKVKDNTTSASSDSTLIARIVLSGVGIPQNTSGEISVTTYPSSIQPVPLTNYSYPLGSRPFVVTQDCNTPKVVRWSRDETVYALDFQLRDQYGDLLFTQFGTYGNNQSPVYYTEFQMTLMCIEGERG